MVSLDGWPLDSGGGPVWVDPVCLFEGPCWIGLVWLCVCVFGAPAGLAWSGPLPLPCSSYCNSRPGGSGRQTWCQLQSRLDGWGWGRAQREGWPFVGALGVGSEKGAAIHGGSTVAASGGRSSLPSGPDPEGTLGPEGWSGPRWPLTWAALLQLLHSHRLGGRRWVLHAAQQRLHEARPVGRADAYVVPRLVLQPLLACGVQAHQDGGPAGMGRRESYRRAGGEEVGAGVWGSGGGRVG